MKVYRLSKLSQHQNAFFFNDIKRFFDPARYFPCESDSRRILLGLMSQLLDEVRWLHLWSCIQTALCPAVWWCSTTFTSTERPIRNEQCMQERIDYIQLLFLQFRKLVNYLEGYAAQHKNVVFIFNIEFTSIIDPLQIEAFHDSLLDLGDFGSDLYKLQLYELSI